MVKTEGKREVSRLLDTRHSEESSGRPTLQGYIGTNNLSPLDGNSR